MELNNLIPKRKSIADRCVIKNDMLYYKISDLSPIIPIAYISVDDIVYVFSDNRVKKVALHIIKDLVQNGNRFYLAYPDSSSPKGVFNFKYKVIRHYLLVFADIKWRNDFDSIGFDIMKNMVDWVLEFSDMELLKEVYDEISKDVMSHYYDWSSKREIYSYDEETRNMWSTVWREIQISQLF